MQEKESDKQKIEALNNAVYAIKNEMLELTNMREDIHIINREKWTEKLNKIQDDLGSKQMLLFIGPFSSGKSSFINAILGKEDILPTNSRPCTSVVTELRFKNDGTGHEGKAVRKDGTESDIVYDFSDLIKMIDGPTGAIGESASYHHIELTYDIAQLRDGNTNLAMLCAAGVTIVDSPGYESPYACSEDIIDEYIGKATHTFWMNPVDQFGGSFEINKIKAIRAKTTTLIPVFTKSDLKPDEEDRKELENTYSETIGGLFRHKEPIFTSAHKWKEGIELIKKNSGAASKEADDLFMESGIYKFLNAMVDATGKKEVTDAKVSSCKIQIEDLLKELKQSATREQNHWLEKLNELGWDEKNNTALNEIKREASQWIKIESKQAGDKLNAHLKDEVLNYVFEAGEKLSTAVLQDKVKTVWKEEIENNSKRWGKELQNIYKDSAKNFYFEEGKTPLIPEWLSGTSFQSQLKDFTDNMMSAIERAGVQSALQGLLGGTLLSLSPALKGWTFLSLKLGAALAPVMLIGGIVFVGLAGFAIMPAYNRNAKDKKEEKRKAVTRKVEDWLEKLDTTTTIQLILMKINDDTFDKLSNESNTKAATPQKNFNTCGEIIRGIDEIHKNIAQQFSFSRDCEVLSVNSV